MRLRRLISFTWLSIALVGLCLSVCGRAEAAADSPRIGLALSGGGARGIAHVGVLAALEEANIPIDAIAGNSMGAIMGGLYASGVSVDSLRSLTTRSEALLAPDSYRMRTVFQKKRLQPSSLRLYFSGLEYHLPRALVGDFQINWILFSHLAEANLAAEGNYDQLPIPFRAVALDLYSGEVVVQREGDLARSIRSSMSVPVTFPPIFDEKRVLVDAGAKNNIPIDLLRDELDCDKVIAVNVAVPWDPERTTDDVTEVALRLVEVLSQRLDSTRVEGWDVWIEPKLGKTGLFEFSKAEFLIQAGYEAAMRAIPRIREILDGKTAAESVPAPAEPVLAGRSVSKVLLHGHRLSFSWIPRTELGIDSGDPFSMDALERGLRRLDSTGIYNTVWPSLELDDHGDVEIHLLLEERPPTDVAFSFLYDTTRDVNVGLEFSRRNFLRLGETIYAKGLLGDFLSGFEGGVRAGHIRGLPIAFDVVVDMLQKRYIRDERGAFRREIHAVEISTGLQASRRGLLLGGLRYQREEGSGSDPEYDFDSSRRSAFATFLFDGTDARYLPNSGVDLRVDYEFFFEEDLDASHHRLSSDVSVHLPLGPVSFGPAGGFSWVSEEELPFLLWDRLDMTRSTRGRFEPQIYAPFIAHAGMTISYELPYRLVAWTESRLGVWSENLDGLESQRPRRSIESGLLQRTRLGPIFLGVSAEQHRSPYYFIQIGHELFER